MISLFENYRRILSHPRTILILKISAFISLFLLSRHALADGGSDLLAGTDQSFWATLNGTGKKYLYGIETIFALGMYIKTKNLMLFGGIFAIAIFFNIALTFSGAQG